MGELTKRAGRVFGAGILVLAVTGIAMMAGTGIANAQPAGLSPACQKIITTLSSFNSSLATSPSTLDNEAATVASALTQAASTGSPALKSTVKAFVTDLEAGAAANNLNIPKLTADAEALTASCAPSGAPATGGGSAAGLQNPALFGVGGAVVLAGVVVLGLALRNRLSTGVSHG